MNLRPFPALLLCVVLCAGCSEDDPTVPTGSVATYDGVWSVVMDLAASNGACGSIPAQILSQLEITQTESTLRVQPLQEDLTTPVGSALLGGVNDGTATYTTFQGSAVAVYSFDLGEDRDSLDGEVAYTEGACNATYSFAGTRAP